MPVDPDAVDEVPLVVALLVEGAYDGDVIAEFPHRTRFGPNPPVERDRVVLDDEEDVPAFYHETPW